MLKKRYLILLLVASFFIPRSFLSVVLSENRNEVSSRSNLENNKIFIDDYKAQCLKALSFYPELKNVIIEFREAEIATTLVARPIISSFFNTDYERTYEVIFNNASDCEVPFSELPEEGQVGILGHELAHSIRNYERGIDRVTVERGLGEKLHDAYHYILEESEASLKYKKFKKFTYLEPHEILAHVRESKIRVGF